MPDTDETDFRTPPIALCLRAGGVEPSALRDLLRDAGFQWVEAPTRGEAEEQLAGRAPAVVLAEGADGADLGALLGAVAGDDRLRAALADLEHLGGVGRWELAPDGRALVLTEAARTLFGVEDDRLLLDELLPRVEEEAREALGAWLTARGVRRDSLDVVVEGRESRRRFLRLRRSRGAAAGALPSGYVQDLGDPWQTLDDGEASCSIDPHTGLPTRDQFVKQLEQSVSRASRRRHQLAAIVIGIEGLREDAMPAEDRAALLRAAVQRLKRSLRDTDLVGKVRTRATDAELARMAGDSFSLMLELERAYDASNVARRLIEHLARPIVLDAGEHELRMNVGIALFPEDGSLAELLLDRAEQAAQEARREGSNCIQYYSCSMNASAFEKLTLESALRQAIEEEQFQVYYQPKVRVGDERIVGFEALVRWRHPDLGLISPGQFIPVAEETGLIVQIGDWVLRRACVDAKAWQDAGLEPVRVSVNLSSVQFREPRLFESVIDALKAADLDPRWLELELTESMLMKDAEGAVAILERLKREGIHIAIDDFGTGYSSLSYLKRFPIDSLKIDQSFVRDINTNADDAAISTSIILMGHSLKLQVVAEGVETRSQLAFLRVMQCDEAQGFLFSPPMPEERARLLLGRAGADAGASGTPPAVDAA